MIPLLFALSLLVPTDDAPDVPLRVETRDGRLVAGSLSRITDDGLHLSTDEGSRRIALDDLLLFHQPPSHVPEASTPPDLLFLSADRGTGDRLVGRLVGGDAYGLRFAVEGGEPVDVPYERIERLLPAVDQPVDRLALLEGAGADDRLWRRQGRDSLTGVVERVEGRQLVFEGALGQLTFELDEVLAVVFAPAPLPEQAQDGLPVVLRLRGGSRLVAGVVAVENDRATLATRFAPRLVVPASALVSAVRRGEGVALLADQQPVEVVEWPSFGEAADFLYPWRADLSVTGRLLRMGGIDRATGLGVHSNARLVFDIPEGARSFRVTVGLVDEVLALPAEGSVRFTILVDGEERADSGVVREGDAPVVLRVDDLDGAERLELHTLDGGDDDAGDRAAWVDGVLLLGAR